MTALECRKRVAGDRRRRSRSSSDAGRGWCSTGSLRRRSATSPNMRPGRVDEWRARRSTTRRRRRAADRRQRARVRPRRVPAGHLGLSSCASGAEPSAPSSTISVVARPWHRPSGCRSHGGMTVERATRSVSSSSTTTTCFAKASARCLSGFDDLEVVGEAASGEAAIAEAARLDPDVVVVDLVMPGMGGVEAIRRMRSAEHPTVGSARAEQLHRAGADPRGDRRRRQRLPREVGRRREPRRKRCATSPPDGGRSRPR